MYEISSECRIVTDNAVYRIKDARNHIINIINERGLNLEIESFIYDLELVGEENVIRVNIEHDLIEII